jgi:carboxylesterase type B
MKTTYPDIAKEVQYLIKRLENSLSFKSNDEPLFGPPPPWYQGVGHGEDLRYMFDIGTMFPSLKGTNLSEKDKEFSKRLMRYWSSFAISG